MSWLVLNGKWEMVEPPHLLERYKCWNSYLMPFKQYRTFWEMLKVLSLSNRVSLLCLKPSLNCVEAYWNISRKKNNTKLKCNRWTYYSNELTSPYWPLSQLRGSQWKTRGINLILYRMINQSYEGVLDKQKQHLQEEWKHGCLSDAEK